MARADGGGPGGFFEELKRRKVVRAVVAYAAIAFLAMQAAELVVPGLGLPEWAFQAVVVVALLGLFEASGDTAALRVDRDEIVARFGHQAIGFPLDMHLFLREFDEALEWVERLPEGLGTQDGPIPSAGLRVMVHGLLGNQDAARREAESALAFLDQVEGRLRPSEWHGHRALALATLGKRNEALAEADRSVEILGPDRWIGPGARKRLMFVHMILGDLDEAIDQLDFLLDAEYSASETVGRTRVDPRYDALRGHSRFERLIAERTLGDPS